MLLRLIQEASLAGGEVIVDSDRVSLGQQPIDQIAGDEPSAAGDEEAHQLASVALALGLRAIAIRFSRNGNLMTKSPTTRWTSLNTGDSLWKRPPKVVLWVIAVIL